MNGFALGGVLYPSKRKYDGRHDLCVNEEAVKSVPNNKLNSLVLLVAFADNQNKSQGVPI